MQLSVRNLSSAFSGQILISFVDPAATLPEEAALAPVYALTIPPCTDGVPYEAVVVPWPKSAAQTDVVILYAATSDAPSTATVHTPTGASTVQIQLLSDGATFRFIG